MEVHRLLCLVYYALNFLAVVVSWASFKKASTTRRIVLRSSSEILSSSSRRGRYPVGWFRPDAGNVEGGSIEP